MQRTCALYVHPSVTLSPTRTDFEGNNGKEAARNGGHPFMMVPEVAGSSSPNITTQADVVLTGCPCLPADGSSWIGQRGDPQRFDRFPRWCYGFAYPVSALRYTGNFHSPDGPQDHAVLSVALDGGTFAGNSINGYDNTRVYKYDPVLQSCGSTFGTATYTDGSALVAFGAGPNFLTRHVTFQGNDGFCWSNAAAGTALGLSNGGVFKLIWPDDCKTLTGQNDCKLLQSSRSSHQVLETIRNDDTRRIYSLGGSTQFATSISPPQWRSNNDSTSLLPIEPSGKRVDGQPVFCVQCTKPMCEAVILTGNLDEFPSLAGQSVYFALQLKANHSSPAFAMEIDGGSGGGEVFATTATATIATSFGWQMHKIFATL